MIQDTHRKKSAARPVRIQPAGIEPSKRTRVTARQGKILAAIVREYTNTCEPVGSESLESAYGFGFSAPTIRNEMRALERAGLIKQPHTSAGRIPTDAGYRYFITELMKHVELTAREQAKLKQQIHELKQQHYELGRTITRLIADSTKSAAFAVLPEASSVAGFSNLVASDLGTEHIRAVAGFLDNLDHQSRALAQVRGGSMQTYIGRESPIPISEDVSMIVCPVELPSGERGMVGIVGSKRMKYGRNMSLLEYVSKLISGGAALSTLAIFLMQK